jgi:hypothetical protein
MFTAKAAHEAIAADLQHKHNTATAELHALLRTGGGTLKVRQRIKVIEADIAEHQADVATAQSEAHSVAVQAAGKRGAELFAEITARIDEALTPFQIPELPDMTNTPIHPAHARTIEAAAMNLAHARQEHTSAQAEHDSAHRSADEVATRLQAVNDRQTSITEARMRGDTSQDLANEFAALAADAQTLQGMLAAARNKASALLPSVSMAARAMQEAQRAMDHVEADATASVLTDRVRQIEEAYVAALRTAQVAHQKAGRMTMGWYEAGLTLRTYVSTGVLRSEYFSAGSRG